MTPEERLSLAAKEGDIVALEAALSDGADPRHGMSESLTEAARYGHSGCVSRLIPVSDPDDNDCAALREATFHGHRECMEILIPCTTVGLAGLVLIADNRRDLADFLLVVSSNLGILDRIGRTSGVPASETL